MEGIYVSSDDTMVDYHYVGNKGVRCCYVASLCTILI